MCLASDLRLGRAGGQSAGPVGWSRLDWHRERRSWPIGRSTGRRGQAKKKKKKKKKMGLGGKQTPTGEALVSKLRRGIQSALSPRTSPMLFA